jgi:hypothetical protein
VAATYVTNAELRTALGIGTLYADVVVEEVCQSAENIVSSKLWRNDFYFQEMSVSNLIATLYFAIRQGMYVAQVVTVSGTGVSTVDGAHTLTASSPNTISFTTTSGDIVRHNVSPLGKCAGAALTDYSLVPEVREASLMIAVDIWQARNTSNSGGVSPDFQPSPYKMGNTLIARVRGLIAGYISPGSLVG